MTQISAQTDRNYARSQVVSDRGIVATSHTLASEAGARILAEGGSAVDAAIAANAVLTVTEPMMCGIGGDLFMLYWDAKTHKLTGLNASGWYPKRLPENLSTMPTSGIRTVSVPGAVDGWAKAHQRFGRLPWARLFDSAIAVADQGYRVPEMLAGAWNSNTTASLDAEGRRVFLPEGKAPLEGDLFRNPDYAATLRTLAGKGAASFYRGEIARAILQTVDKRGGTMDAADLSEFSSEWVDPIATTYRGWTLYELPPNGQGMAALQILNMLETMQPAAAGPRSTAELHKRIEATKLAYSDLMAYNADPKISTIPIKGLIDKSYAKSRAQGIDPDRANCNVTAGKPPNGDTVYLSVIDREGNIASWIQSISAQWGSGVGVEGAGFILHNRAAGFVLDKGHPNVLAGRKRPFHSIIPAFLEKDDQHIGFGIMGGPNQPLAHAQFVSNLVDYGMNLQGALEEPRFTKRTFTGCEISLESRIPEKVQEDLRSMGHLVTGYKDYSIFMGRGQAVMRDEKRKLNVAASDPRADGAAVEEPLPISKRR